LQTYNIYSTLQLPG